MKVSIARLYITADLNVSTYGKFSPLSSASKLPYNFMYVERPNKLSARLKIVLKIRKFYYFFLNFVNNFIESVYKFFSCSFIFPKIRDSAVLASVKCLAQLTVKEN
jgi:hypothetical protein